MLMTTANINVMKYNTDPHIKPVSGTPIFFTAAKGTSHQQKATQLINADKPKAALSKADNESLYFVKASISA